MSRALIADAWQQTVASVRRKFATEYHNSPQVRVRDLVDMQVEITVPERLNVPFLVSVCRKLELDAEIDISQPEVVVVRLTRGESDDHLGVDALLSRVAGVSSAETQAMAGEVGIENWAQARAMLATSMLCGLEFRRDNITFHPYNPASELVFHYTGQTKLTLRNFRHLHNNWMITTNLLIPGAVVFGLTLVSDNLQSVYGQRQARMQSSYAEPPEQSSRKRRAQEGVEYPSAKRTRLTVAT